MKESLRLEIGSTKGQEVNGGESSLLARGNKDDDRGLWGILADGLVDWFHHGDESRRSVGDVKTLRQFHNISLHSKVTSTLKH